MVLLEHLPATELVLRLLQSGIHGLTRGEITLGEQLGLGEPRQ